MTPLAPTKEHFTGHQTEITGGKGQQCKLQLALSLTGTTFKIYG